MLRAVPDMEELPSLVKVLDLLLLLTRETRTISSASGSFFSTCLLASCNVLPPSDGKDQGGRIV